MQFIMCVFFDSIKTINLNTKESRYRTRISSLKKNVQIVMNIKFKTHYQCTVPLISQYQPDVFTVPNTSLKYRLYRTGTSSPVITSSNVQYLANQPQILKQTQQRPDTKNKDFQATFTGLFSSVSRYGTGY
jgi:hypothetical protein